MNRTEPFVIHEKDCDLECWDSPPPGHGCWRTLISGDRTPTDSLTVGVAEVEPGESGDFHSHRHAQPEVYYILSGEGVVTLSGNEYQVRAGSTVFIPGTVEHSTRNTGTELLRLLYVFPANSFSEITYEFRTA